MAYALPSEYRLEEVGPGDDQNATGDLDIYRDPTYGATGSKTVYIQGNGNILLAFYMGASDRLIDIPATETDLTVVVEGLLIKAGEAPAQQIEGRGGCVRAQAGTLWLLSVNFQDCIGYFEGGAIAAMDADLYMDNCNLGDNQVTVPSGWSVPVDTKGGALYAYDSTVEIADSSFLWNVADSGAGIWAAAAWDEGEGVYAGTFTMTDSEVSENVGYSYGGGLHLRLPFLIEQSTVAANQLQDLVSSGGGLYAEVPYGAGEIGDSVFDGNFLVEVGGAIAVRDTYLEVYRSSIIGHDDVSRGGGVHADVDSTIILNASYLGGNTAQEGGAVYVEDGSTVRFENASTSDNQADVEGGAVYNHSGYVHALHSSFWNDACSSCASGSIAGIFGEVGTTNELDRSILMANASGGMKHCAEVTSLGDVLSESSACFTPDVVDGSAGIGLCVSPSCTVPVVSVGSPSKALDNAIPCGMTLDARGVSRNASKCDIGAYEAP